MIQKRKLATKFCPPNIKQLDYPPAKKSRTAQAAPEFHIAVNLAPTAGVGVPALQGTCVVSNSQVLQPGSSSAPGPSRVEEVADVEELGKASDTPDPRPLGRRVYIPQARKMILQRLLDCANTDRVPSTLDILTWMDTENPDMCGFYRSSHSEFQAFEVEDAFDVMENEICYLALFGGLRQDCAVRVRQYTRDNILVPLGLWETDVDSFGSGGGLADLERVLRWRNEAESGYVEDIEDVEDYDEVKVEEVEEPGEDSDSDIEEIESWNWKRAVSEEI